MTRQPPVPGDGEPERVRERTDAFRLAWEATPEVGKAAGEAPLLPDDLSAGAVPLTERLRDRRTQASIIVPVVVLVLFALALPGFELDTLVDHVLSADLLSVEGAIRAERLVQALGSEDRLSGLAAEVARDGATVGGRREMTLGT